MDDNAEQGIALSHAKAAQSKLDHAKGFKRQHDWSIDHLDERIFGMFIMLIVVILVAVWAFDVPPLIRYAVTIGAGSVVISDVPDRTSVAGNPAKQISTK